MAAQKPSISEGDEEYLMLKDLRISLEQKDGAFSLCLWIYLSNYTLFPATIIEQTHPDADGSIPLLALNEEKKLMLFPMLFLHEEAPQPCNSASWTNVPCIAADAEFPSGKWVHVGCEVATNFVRLHINGGMVGEKPLSYSSTKDPDHESVQKITLVGNDGGDQRMQGYVHFVRTYPMPTSISDHFPKNPPLELSIDSSSFSENHDVEESGDGLWSVVGGKASCRRNFSLDVILSDALGCSVQKEMELFASLVYADNGAPVEKPKDDAEAPLLISYDGVEFPSSDRPIKLINGRASFKLKISQLSSKCENRLFRIQFCPPESQSYPFLEAYSRPIRCISRNRNSRTSSMLWKKTATTANQHDRPQSSGPDEGSPKVQYNNGDGHSEILTPHVKYSPPFKRVKVVHEKSPMRIYADGFLEHLDHGCNSQLLTTKDDGNVLRTSLRGRLANLERTESIPSDSESVHARNSAFKSMADLKTPISDFILFKYCLGGIYERNFDEKEEEVSLLMACHVKEETHKNLWYFDTGCSNHMSGEKSVFSELDGAFHDVVRFSDGSTVSVIGKGKVAIQTNRNSIQTISNVLFVPDLRTNLLSVGQLQEKGYGISIKNGVCRIEDEKLGLIAQVNMTTNRMFPLCLHDTAHSCFSARLAFSVWAS